MSEALSKAYAKFLRNEVENHTHALTITLRTDSQLECGVNRRNRFQETLRHLLNRINRSIFNHRHKREKYGIGVVTAIESGNKFNRLHAHLSLACPPELSFTKFELVVHKAVSKCRSLGRVYELKMLSDRPGWAAYLSKDGTEAFAPECSQRAKH
jgi:hypothetical protein